MKELQELHWNPWHGCTRISDGCLNCYMYEIDSRYKINSAKVVKTSNFNLPVQRDGNYDYILENTNSGFIYTCLSSDFFHEKADEWRKEAWSMIKERNDLNFMLFTKRIERFYEGLPRDWGEGYDNVFIGVSCENQEMVDKRVSEIVKLPIKHKIIYLAPLLERVDIERYLRNIEMVSVSGESCGPERRHLARVLDYDWVLDVREQCIRNDVNFEFMQTGTNFKKDGHIYRLKSHTVQLEQAIKANIDYFK